MDKIISYEILMFHDYIQGQNGSKKIESRNIHIIIKVHFHR